MAYYDFKKSSGGSGVEAIIDQSEYIANTFINPGSGAASPSGGWTATPFIEVVPGEVLTFAAKNNGSGYFSKYDANQTWLGSFTLSDFGYVLFTVPSDTHYIRLSNQDANMAHLMAWRGLST